MESLSGDILTITDISKGYKENDVLKKVSFTVKQGEFLSILGSSGCGKTTLLRILMGLLKPDTGSVFKGGEDITSARPDKRGMGIVFQNYALFENMTVLQNVEYALKINPATRETARKNLLESRGETEKPARISPIELQKEVKRIARESALEMIETVGLAEHAKKYPRALSGGQQQRVAIARTLVLKPDIVLFDEPMSALDVATRIALRAELKRLQQHFGTTMIYVTHDQEEAFALSDRIMIMNSGEISQLDTPENIFKNPANDYIKSFVLDNLQAKADSLAKFITVK